MNPQRRTLLLAGALAPLAIAGLARAQETMESRIRRNHNMTPTHNDGRNDFDFFHGNWQIRNQRLRERLVGSEDWETFDATQSCAPILGGLGNIDDFHTDWSDGFIGMSLRLFDPKARQWSIYWASNRSGVLEPPVVGAFDNGVGTFYGRDEHKGTPVLARFIWSDIKRDNALWQQAFSTDEGETWETNWIMHMTRAA
ncbi:MAG: hypothetical protein ACREPX_08960 [Rhodanobacteraceae bacterium]